MIVKIQKPMFKDIEPPTALITNRDKSYRKRVPLPMVEHLFGHRENRAYFKARLDDGELVLGRKLLPQLF